MAVNDQTPREATMTLPDWFWGGKPEEFLDSAGLRGVGLGSGRWKVSTTERYTKCRPSLVLVDPLTGPEQVRRRIGQLTMNRPVMDDLAVDVSERWNRAIDASHTGSSAALAELMFLGQVRTQTAAPEELPDAILDVRRALDACTGASASTQIIRRAPELALRGRLPSVLLRQAHDPELRAGNLHGVHRANSAGQLVFTSAGALMSGVALLGPYLGPLQAALTPAVWAFPAARSFGTIVYTLGKVVLGRNDVFVDPLQVVSPVGGPTAKASMPAGTSAAAASAIDWWTSRLNDFFGVLTDPSVFTDKSAIYSPTKHLQALLTAEQLFSRTHSLLCAHRDPHARRTLLFSVLDALPNFTGQDLIASCRLDLARKTFERVKAVTPDDAAQLLLPAAARGLDALEQLQDGFFLGRPEASNTVKLFYGERSTEELDIARATSLYISILRNATHGFGATRGDSERANALLAHHTGEIPDDLGLLAYLYLLDVISSPDRLRAVLYNKGKVKA